MRDSIPEPTPPFDDTEIRTTRPAAGSISQVLSDVLGRTTNGQFDSDIKAALEDGSRLPTCLRPRQTAKQ